MDAYNAKSIKTLEGIEAIRLRSGMYIGSVGPEGVRHITLEIISNVVDEYLNGHCNRCEITVKNNNEVTIIDNGRGVPFGKQPDGSETLVNVYTKLHTGAKFDTSGASGYNTSGGLNGVGAKATNALSEYFKVTSYRDGKRAAASFKRGKLIDFNVVTDASGRTGTEVTFCRIKRFLKRQLSLIMQRSKSSFRNQLFFLRV